MAKPTLSNDEKIDWLYHYARRTYHWAVFRGVISFLIFLVFVVLPLIGGVFVFRYFKNDFDWGNLQSQFQDFKSFGESFKQFGEVFGSSESSGQKPSMPKSAN